MRLKLFNEFPPVGFIRRHCDIYSGQIIPLEKKLLSKSMHYWRNCLIWRPFKPRKLTNFQEKNKLLAVPYQLERVKMLQVEI